MDWTLYYEKVLPHNVYLKHNIGTNKTQVLHRLRLRQFTPRQLIPCILDCLPSQHNFLPTRLKFGYHRASLYSNCSPSVKRGAMSNSICGSNGKVQHADSSLREKVSRCKKRMTHKILQTHFCPIQFFMTDSKPIERHSKGGVQL